MRRLLQHRFVRRHLSLAAILQAMRQPTYLLALLALVSLWGFAALADSIDDHATLQFDETILESLRVADDPARLIGPPWTAQAVRDLTALGGETILALVTTIVCVYLSLAGRRDLCFFTAAAVISGTVVMFTLKDVFDRPRPELVPHILVSVSSDSFPSGHAMGSAIVYLTLGAMLAEAARTWQLKAYVLTVAVLLTLVIGSTRVFLGVHYPTDVLAGWAAGFLWAYSSRTLVRLWQFWQRYRKTGIPPNVESSTWRE